MYCAKCGSQVDSGERRCRFCGARVPSENATPETIPFVPEKKKTKKSFLLGALCGVLIAALLSASLLVTGILRPAADSIEGKGFSTPEEAVTAYLEALRDANMEEILATFANETYFKNLDLSSRYLIYGSAFRASYGFLPTEIEFAQSLNTFKRSADLAKKIVMPYIILSQMPEGSFSVQKEYGNFSDAKSAEELIETYSDPIILERLKTLKIGKFLPWTDFVSDEDRNRLEEMFSEYEEGMNAEELLPVIVEVELAGYDLYFTMDTVCYDGVWYNFTIGSGFYAVGEGYPGSSSGFTLREA